jgi:signal transduction histidine kinase
MTYVVATMHPRTMYAVHDGAVEQPVHENQTDVLPLVVDMPTSRSAVHPSLVCVSGADLGKSFRVGFGTSVIGRGNADIALTEGDVSRQHARFSFGDHGFEITDLGSSNGTLVNGARAGDVPLPVRVGDKIQLGRTVLVFAQHDELEQRVQHMQRLESMATLAGGIAHDFNNALAVVVGNLEHVERALPADADEALESIAEMRAAATSATALARRLLRLGRQRDDDPLSFAPVPLEPIATQTSAMARRKTRHGIRVAIDVPPQMRVLGSYDELHQVLLNLCLNACDAMPDGGLLAIAARHVTLAPDAALAHQLSSAGDYVELRVTDTGSGMDQATLARAFEPFFTTKPRDKGTGLGLAMIHNSIRRHGGAIVVESVVGSGTTFRILLPEA